MGLVLSFNTFRAKLTMYYLKDNAKVTLPQRSDPLSLDAVISLSQCVWLVTTFPLSDLHIDRLLTTRTSFNFLEIGLRSFFFFFEKHELI